MFVTSVVGARRAAKLTAIAAVAAQCISGGAASAATSGIVYASTHDVNGPALYLHNTSTHTRLPLTDTLGAGRGRLIRQLLTESAMLACLGGAVGLLFAWWGLDLLVTLKPANLPRLDSISIDGRVLIFTLAVSLLTGLLFGLIPALHSSKLNINELLP